MKISQNTLTILKNFNTINQHFGVKPGNVIRTMSAATFAMAKVAEEFPVEFAVEKLAKFIGVITLFEDPDFEFFDQYVKISEGKNYVRYIYDEPSLLNLPPDKSVKMPEIDVEFDLSEKDHSLVMKAASSLESPYLSFDGEDGTIYIRAIDIKNPTSSSFSMAVGITDKSFSTAFNAENFRFLNRDYKVSLVIDKVAEFKTDDVTYWLAGHRE